MEALAELKVGDWEALIGKVEKSFSALDKSIKDFSRDTPFFPRTLVSTGQVGAAGSYVIDLGSPTQGKFWCITLVSLFKQGAPASPPANFTSATAYLGNMEDQLSDMEVLIPSLGTNAAPGLQLFGNETVYQYPGEDLFIVVTAGGASAGTGIMKVKEFAIDDVMPRRI